VLFVCVPPPHAPGPTPRPGRTLGLATPRARPAGVGTGPGVRCVPPPAAAERSPPPKRGGGGGARRGRESLRREVPALPTVRCLWPRCPGSPAPLDHLSSCPGARPPGQGRPCADRGRSVCSPPARRGTPGRAGDHTPREARPPGRSPLSLWRRGVALSARPPRPTLLTHPSLAPHPLVLQAFPSFAVVPLAARILSLFLPQGKKKPKNARRRPPRARPALPGRVGRRQEADPRRDYPGGRRPGVGLPQAGPDRHQRPGEASPGRERERERERGKEGAAAEGPW
jgi:hypothetical protein